MEWYRLPYSTQYWITHSAVRVTESEPRIGKIVMAWQNTDMTESVVNTVVTSTSSSTIPAEISAASPAIRAVNCPPGAPLGKHPTRVLLLGAGESGKEVAIEFMRPGAWMCAADSYTGVPAQ